MSISIFIPIEEIDEKYHMGIRLGVIKKVGIDYATNTIDCYLDDSMSDDNVSHLVKFNDYGIRFDNRYNGHECTIGSAGIMVNFSKRKES